MAKCSKCGEESMSFTCRYCGKKFCSSHRLPENHDCQEMEEEVEKQREETGKWFQEKEVRKDLKPPETREPSVARDALETLKGSGTLAIIAVTLFAFLLQGMVPGFTGAMLLDPAINSLIQRPWSLLTVMLVHGGFFHIFANMVTFYFFGTPLERTVGTREMLIFYIGSGIAASIGYVAFRNLLLQIHGPAISGLPTLGPAVGASGAVVAVFATVAMLYPEAEVLLYFFIPMKIRTALKFFAVFEGIGMLSRIIGFNLPGFLGSLAFSAHFTGLIIGYLYGRKLRNKYNTRTGVLDLLGY